MLRLLIPAAIPFLMIDMQTVFSLWFAFYTRFKAYFSGALDIKHSFISRIMVIIELSFRPLNEDFI